MWNKKEIEKLRNEIEYLKKARLKELQEPKKNVYVYLDNNNTITIYDADDFGYETDDDMVKIIKNNEINGLIKIDGIIAISNTPISIDENKHLYTISGERI